MAFAEPFDLSILDENMPGLYRTRNSLGTEAAPPASDARDYDYQERGGKYYGSAVGSKIADFIS